MKQPPAVAYKAHLETIQSQWEAALAATQFDAVIWVGGDMYPGARFLAPYVPVLLVLALAAIGGPSMPRCW